MGVTINMTSPVRVLVVDDFKPWLTFVDTMLAKELDIRVEGVALDGMEAVAQAQTLQPDLILMDIGLPIQSGIEAACQIINLAPRTRIIFVSQDRDPGVVRAALAAGGVGYVVKSYAGSELLPAMKAALQGKRYFSCGLSDLRLTETAGI
jgi:DNA-binding NarL/FixJ family response regulator